MAVQKATAMGGITGVNYSSLKNNTVGLINMDIQGIYTANSSSTVQQKEAQATHAGGIAGKNETTGIVEHAIWRIIHPAI